MKLTSSCLYLLVLLTAIAVTGFTGCGTQTNRDNVAVNTSTNVLPLNTPTPTPPPCDDAAINQELYAVFTANQDGKDGFKDIRKTVNFYSRNCEIHLWGYTKSVGRFKKFLKLLGDVRRVKTASLPENFENLFIDRSDYPYLPSFFGNCSSPYKKCGDICIPETDSCWADFAR
jgi:hypothetical protein